ncbi:helix-turn-helix domain-containing protein [Herbiconiux sp. YIM B11900]|uniref:helix-turn-helix domain-containing protein n=1 Tax=Herbiconiux sp. YIM B11900 TaxID=3404131 RepID=UPI003F860400
MEATSTDASAWGAEAFVHWGLSAELTHVLRALIGSAGPSTADIQQASGLSRSGVLKHLHHLEDLGMATSSRTTHPRGKGPITYWHADPAAVEDALLALVDHIMPLAASEGSPC